MFAKSSRRLERVVSSQPKPVPSEHIYFKIGHLYLNTGENIVYTTQDRHFPSFDKQIAKGTIFLVCEIVNSERVDIRWSRVIFQDIVGWIRIWNDKEMCAKFSVMFPEVLESGE